jgi:capsular polysaccharide biosynthesis protein
MRNLLLGLFLAGFAGIACAFVFEQLDDSMKTSGEVERKLHLPVLATIAHDKAI